MRNKNSCSHKLVGVTFQTKSNGQGKGLVIIFQKKLNNEILEVENYNLIKNQIFPRTASKVALGLRLMNENR